MCDLLGGDTAEQTLQAEIAQAGDEAAFVKNLRGVLP
jgi:hypothetical protein